MEELIPIVLFSCIAAVLILRPITKKLGLLLEAFARERMSPAPARADADQIARLADSLERINARLDLMEDRVGFVERLLEARPRPRQRLTG